MRRKMKQQKCFYCGDNIDKHNFSHKSECKAKDCDCEGFVYETRKCDLCDKIIDRNYISELMLNPHMQLIPLCEEHFKYEPIRRQDVKNNSNI